MLTSVNLRSDQLRIRATFAMVLAIVLVWVVGSGLGPTALSAGDDGLIGATAERVEFGSLPAGKQVHEGLGQVAESTSESETEGFANALGQARLDAQARIRAPFEIERESPLRVCRCIAAIRARGPPVG
jgi:hypothetical protein